MHVRLENKCYDYLNTSNSDSYLLLLSQSAKRKDTNVYIQVIPEHGSLHTLSLRK